MLNIQEAVNHVHIDVKKCYEYRPTGLFIQLPQNKDRNLPNISWLLLQTNDSMICTGYLAIIPARNISKLSRIPLAAIF